MCGDFQGDTLPDAVNMNAAINLGQVPAAPQEPGVRQGNDLLILIPIFNEQENLPMLFDRLTKACDSLPGIHWRVIFINDGSSDDSQELILAHRKIDARWGLISLSRNFGHQAAVSAGIDHANADAVVVMDADLQDPPELLGQMISRWREGFDVVYAVRRTRQEGLLLRMAYRSFYRLLRSISKVNIPPDAGDFCLMDRKVVRQISRLPERNRFVRGLRAWVGFKQTPLEYDRPERFAGTSKYSIRKLVRLAMSGFLGFSMLPLRLATWAGIASALLALCLILVVVICWVANVHRVRDTIGWSSTVAIILFMSGVQLMILGVIGEYLGLVADEARRRPTYVVDLVEGVMPDSPSTTGSRENAMPSLPIGTDSQGGGQLPVSILPGQGLQSGAHNAPGNPTR